MVVLNRRATVAAITDEVVVVVLTIDPALGRAPTPQLASALETYFAIRLQVASLDESLERLVASGRLTPSIAGGYEVEPENLRAETDRIAGAVALERKVREEWIASLPDLLREEPAAGQLWGCLQAFMSRALLRHGAETAALLNPEVTLTPELDRSIGSLLEEAAQSTCKNVPVNDAVAEVRRFFENASGNRVTYVAQLMDGAFAIFALSVDEATAHYLKTNLPQLDVFLDTNFIFGVLGLNDHPDVELATEFLQLIVQEKFPFKLYYHEETLAEIRRTIEAIAERLTRRRWQAALSRAAIQTNLLTDVELRYHRLNATTPTDPDIFMSKYDHMELLLQEKGFSIFRTQAAGDDEMNTRAELVAQYDDFIQQRRRDRPKPYATMNHDMAVWLSLQVRRKRAKSVLEAGAIFLSMDYLLYRFDWASLRRRGEPGTVVLPRLLVQILRPFSGAASEYDKRFVEAFSIPELRAVRIRPGTAAKVLSVLNTYNDVGEETALRILTSEVVAAKLSRLREDAPTFAAAVESAVADDNRMLLEEREALRQQTGETRLALAAETARREQAERDAAISKERSEESDRLRTAEAKRVSDQAAEVSSARERASQLEDDLRAARAAASRSLWTTVVLAGAIGCLAVAGAWISQAGSQLAQGSEFVRLLAGLLAIWLGLLWGWADPPRRIGVLTILVGAGVLTALSATPALRDILTR